MVKIPSTGRILRGLYTCSLCAALASSAVDASAYEETEQTTQSEPARTQSGIGEGSGPTPFVQATRLRICPDPGALDVLKHEVAYQRTEESYPLQGLQVIHANVWQRGNLTAFYIHERPNGFIPTVRVVYSVEDHEAQGLYTCSIEQNWRTCVEQHSDLAETAQEVPRTCTATVDVGNIPAWTPSPDDQTKQHIAGELRDEILAKWRGALEIIVRDFNLKDSQITIYLKMPDGEYIQGCGFRLTRLPYCNGWHSFGNARVSTLKRWILEEPYRLK